MASGSRTAGVAVGPGNNKTILKKNPSKRGFFRVGTFAPVFGESNLEVLNYEFGARVIKTRVVRDRGGNRGTKEKKSICSRAREFIVAIDIICTM